MIFAVVTFIYNAVDCIKILIGCVLQIVLEIISLFTAEIYTFIVRRTCEQHGILIHENFRPTSNTWKNRKFDWIVPDTATIPYTCFLDIASFSDIVTRTPTSKYDILYTLIDETTNVIIYNYSFIGCNLNSSISFNKYIYYSSIITELNMLTVKLGHRIKMLNHIEQPNPHHLQDLTLNIPLLKYVLSTEFQQDIWTLYLLGPLSVLYVIYLINKVKALSLDGILQLKEQAIEFKHNTEEMHQQQIDCYAHVHTLIQNTVTYCNNNNIQIPEELSEKINKLNATV